MLRSLRLTLSVDIAVLAVNTLVGLHQSCSADPVQSQGRSLEDALMAELCPSEDGGHLASRTGLLLRRLEACTPADEEYTSANPLQVSTTFSLALQGAVRSHLYELASGHPCSALCKT